MGKKVLNEEMRRLMGISRQRDGGLPVLFERTPVPVLEEARRKTKPKKRKPKKENKRPRSMTLFQSESAMITALERAHKLIARVNASVLASRNASNRGQMHEMERVSLYRLDQELAASQDAVLGAREALEQLSKAKEQAEQHANQQRRQGRR